MLAACVLDSTEVGFGELQAVMSGEINSEVIDALALHGLGCFLRTQLGRRVSTACELFVQIGPMY